MDAETNRRLWLRTLVTMALAGAVGLLIALYIDAALRKAVVPADFDRYLQPVGAMPALEAIARGAVSATQKSAYLWSAVVLGALLTLSFPLLFTPALFRRPARRWHSALRYLIVIAVFGGLGQLLDPMHGGDPESLCTFLGLALAAWFVLVGPLALSPARLRAWRALGWRGPVVAAALGMAAGVGGGLLLHHIGAMALESSLQSRLHEAVSWAVHPESLRMPAAMAGFTSATVVRLALGGAAVLGLVVALTPSATTARGRALALALVSLPAAALLLHDQLVPVERRLKIFPHVSRPDLTYALGAQDGASPNEAQAVIAAPDAPSPAPHALGGEETKWLQATPRNLKLLDAFVRSKRADPRYLFLALEARWQLAMRLRQPARALEAMLDDAERTGSIFATMGALAHCVRNPPSTTTRAVFARLRDPARFIASPRGMREMSEAFASVPGWASALRRAAQRRAGRLPALPPRWHGGKLRGCIESAVPTLEPGRARVWIHRVFLPFEIGAPLAATDPDAEGCYAFEGLYAGTYGVGLVWLDTPPQKVHVAGRLGPIRVDQTRPSADLGTVRIAQENTTTGCPDGHTRSGGGCRRGCDGGRVVVGGHCCWPEQRWDERLRACAGKARCPAGSVALGQICTPEVSLPQAGDASPRVLAPGGNGKDPSPMVVVEAGTFVRGAARLALGNDVPQRAIELSTYAIDQREVSVARYRRCVDAGRCPRPAKGKTEALADCNWGRPGRAEHPANCIGVANAWAYCTWAGKRLPSEAEWEKAARGLDRRRYPWGDQEPTCQRVAHYRGEDFESLGSPSLPGDKEHFCRRGTMPVSQPGGAGSSPFGALHMAGNVAEWVADWYAPGYYATSPARDPRGPAQGQQPLGTQGPLVVVRGGSWADPPRRLRVTSRTAYHAGARHSKIGFRCAVDLGAQGPPAGQPALRP